LCSGAGLPGIDAHVRVGELHRIVLREQFTSNHNPSRIDAETRG
jgi:hypothetical protein